MCLLVPLVVLLTIAIEKLKDILATARSSTLLVLITTPDEMPAAGSVSCSLETELLAIDSSLSQFSRVANHFR